jgi:hypothetical protein
MSTGLRLEPLGHLRDLLCLQPGWHVQRVLELAPAIWRATVKRAEIRAALDLSNAQDQIQTPSLPTTHPSLSLLSCFLPSLSRSPVTTSLTKGA